MSRTRAVIYVAPELSLDSPHTQNRMAWAVDRGYQLAAIMRDWDIVDRCLLVGYAQVAIVASDEHSTDKTGAPRLPSRLAPVYDLARQRSLTTTRRLSPKELDAPTGADARHGNTGQALPRRTAQQCIDDAIRRWRALQSRASQPE